MGDENSQRRFIRVPVSTIQSCVDRLGVKASEEVSSGLSEDVSFRIRQITESACQFMHHAKRRCLTVEDMERAMKYSGLEPLYGHHSELTHQYGTLMLEQVASATSLADSLPDHTLPNHPPLVTAAWQVVEGVELEDREVMQGTVKLSKDLSDSHQTFLSLLLEASTGGDEDKRRIALAAVQSKPAVASILPSLVQYLQDTLSKWEVLTPAQLQRVLKLCLALLTNCSLFLDPYAPSLYPLLRDVLLTPGYPGGGGGGGAGGEEGEVTHWHVRAMAAAAVAQLLKRCASPLNMYSQELSAHFQQLFQQRPSPQQCPSLPVLYGALHVLHHLGAPSIAEQLCPHLETLVGFLNTCSASADKEHLFRLQEALLVVARTLLISEEKLSVVLAGRPPDRHSSSATDPSPPTRDSTHHAVVTAAVGGGQAGTSGGVVEENTIFGNAGLSFGAVDPATSTSGSGEGEKSPSHLQEPPISSSSSLTLYDHVAELLGEGLILSLSIPAHTVSSTSATPSVPPRPPRAKTSPIGSSSEVSEHVTRSLDNFLKREGFRPARTSLHRATPPTPRGYYRMVQPFAMPRLLLPVQGNVLEQRGRPPHTQPQGHARIVKGAWPGHRRHYIMRDQSECPVDIGSSWL